MNRQQKELVIKELHNDFTESQALFLVGYRGLSVAQMQVLRKELHEKGGLLKVAKIRLMKRAIKGIEKAEALMPYLNDQLALVFTEQEAPAIAKVLYNFANENEQLHLVAGCLGSEFLTHEAISQIAKLPSKQVLYAQLCGIFESPIAQLIHTLNAPISQIITILQKMSKHKS